MGALHREGQHLADVCVVGEEHHQPVNAHPPPYIAVRDACVITSMGVVYQRNPGIDQSSAWYKTAGNLTGCC